MNGARETLDKKLEDMVENELSYFTEYVDMQEIEKRYGRPARAIACRFQSL